MARAPSSAASAADLFRTLVLALGTAAAAEFLLLRVANRMAERLPWRELGGVVVGGGAIAMNLALLLALSVIAFAGWSLRARIRTLPPWMIAAAVAAGVASAVGGAAVALGAGILAASLIAALAIRRSWIVIRGTGLRGLLGEPAVILLAVTAVGATLYLRLGDAAAALGTGPPGRAAVFGAGEALAVATALAAGVVYRQRPTLANVGLPLALVAVAAVPMVLRTDLVPLMAFWSLGLQMTLFPPLYLVGLAFFGHALANLARRGGPRLFGLLLLGVAGRLLADFYGVALVLAGIALLALADELPWPRPSASPRPRTSPAKSMSAAADPGN